MSLQVLNTISAMREVRAVAGRKGKLGLVPTMGALHEGHLSLVRAARRECDVVAASIFVNPTQFAANEDFSKYPRTFEDDCSMLEAEGVELLFAPSVEEMYPAGAQTYVDVGEVGSRLDGKSRPGHFRGVVTVVSKLFHIVMPDAAYFGQKDAAQVAVLQAMVRDLNFPLQMVVCPTVRDNDGLALSSRNRYLSHAERSQALALPRALGLVADMVEGGTFAADELCKVLRTELRKADGIRLDYAEIVDPATLQPLEHVRKGALVAVAGWVGSTRLIDNVVLAPQVMEERR